MCDVFCNELGCSIRHVCLLVGDGDGDAEVVSDGGAHGRDALHQACHHRAA